MDKLKRTHIPYTTAALKKPQDISELDLWLKKKLKRTNHWKNK